MPQTFYSHRSGAETYQRCPRAAYLEYHHLGIGIQQAPMAIWLDIGNAVHLGLAWIMTHEDIEGAVAEALEFYMRSDQPIFRGDETVEQTWLIECILRSFWEMFWPMFKQSYEVLYVEQEVDETYKVDEPEQFIKIDGELDQSIPGYIFDLVFSSRPDVIVKDRRTQEVIGISWKTIDDLTDYRRTKFTYDLQGFTEMYYAGKLFVDQVKALEAQLQTLTTGRMRGSVRERIEEEIKKERLKLDKGVDAIQTIFFQKGKRIKEGWDEDSPFERDEDPDKTGYMVNSFLTRPWRQKSTGTLAHSYRYLKPGNKSQSTISPKDWERIKAFDMGSLPIHMGPEEWVKMLHRREVFPSSDYPTIDNPLTKVVIYDQPIPRDAQMLDSIINQVLEQEIRKCRNLIDIAEEHGEEGKRVLIERYFPQYMQGCTRDFRCQFFNFCHGPVKTLDLVNIPNGFERRKPHHATEAKAVEGENKQ